MPTNLKQKRARLGREGGEASLKALFVRAAPDLLEALDEYVRRQRYLHPGMSISRADVVRELLYESLRARSLPAERARK
jgi:hypothetical protein